jgi:uncharacterized tellurite resistance protein B-like protein
MARELNWERIRYRGDQQDIESLIKDYQVDTYLKVRESHIRDRELSLRNHLLRDGVRLDENISPRIFTILSDLLERLAISLKFEIYSLNSLDINALAYMETEGDKPRLFIIGITSGALEKLSDAEIKSIIGHEFGHIIFMHNPFLGLLNDDPNTPKPTVLPPFAEIKFLQWRKKSEISADRVSLIGSGDYASTARTLLKAHYGLSEKNLNLDLDSLLKQIDEIKGKPELLSSTFKSHPVLPIRLKALHEFSKSGIFYDSTGTGIEGKKPPADSEVEDTVDTILDCFKRYPATDLGIAVMKVIAAGGMKIAMIDKDPSEDEISNVVDILLDGFTDEPEKEILDNLESVDQTITTSCETIKKEGDLDDVRFTLSRLSDVCIADGKLLEDENQVFFEIAELLGVNNQEARAILIGAVRSIGFNIDIKMKNIVHNLRKELLDRF